MVLVFVGRFIWSADLAQIKGYLKKMPWTFWGVVGFSFLAYMSATYAWRLFMGKEGKNIPLFQLFMIRHVGEMLSVFNPTSVIAGETLKAHYLKKYGVSKETSVSSILLSRILIILSALFLILVSTIYLIAGTLGDQLDVGVIIATLSVASFLGFLLARYLVHSKLLLHKNIKGLQSRFGTKYISDDLCNSILDINQASHNFFKNHKGKFILAFGLSTIHWIFGAAEFYLVLQVLGIDVSIGNAVAIEMGVILFKTMGAIVPGQVGVEEYANKIMLEAVGITGGEIWIVVSIMRRARQLFWAGVAAFFYWILRKSGGVVTPEASPT